MAARDGETNAPVQCAGVKMSKAVSVAAFLALGLVLVGTAGAQEKGPERKCADAAGGG